MVEHRQISGYFHPIVFIQKKFVPFPQDSFYFDFDLFKYSKKMACSLNAKTHEMFLKDSDRKITFLVIRPLNLYVITDARGFGNNWIKVSHSDKKYDSVPLMGADEEQNMSSVARFFASAVIKQRQNAGLENLPSIEKTEMLFSVCLRDTSPSTIREIEQEFEKIIDF